MLPICNNWNSAQQTRPFQGNTTVPSKMRERFAAIPLMNTRPLRKMPPEARPNGIPLRPLEKHASAKAKRPSQGKSSINPERQPLPVALPVPAVGSGKSSWAASNTSEVTPNC
jgi:hypothetical protein